MDEQTARLRDVLFCLGNAAAAAQRGDHDDVARWLADAGQITEETYRAQLILRQQLERDIREWNRKRGARAADA